MASLKRNHCTRPLSYGVVVFAVGVLWTASAVAQDHGVGTGKSCPTATKVGDIATCTLRVNNQDEFGDTLRVLEFWDLVGTGGGQFRVPAAGNLPIIEVSPGVICTAAPVSPSAPMGLVFPCDIPGIAQPDGSNLFVRVESSWTVPAGFTDPVIDQGNVIVDDQCNVQPTGCNPNNQQQQFGAAVSLFVPDLEVTKTGPADAKVGDEVCYDIVFNDTSTGTGFPGFENCTGTDSVLGALGAFVDGVSRQFCRTALAGDPDPLINVATISCGVVGFDNVVEDDDDHSVNLIDPSIEVAKTGPANAKVGDEVCYDITFNNTGEGSVENCSGNDTVLGALGAFEDGVTRQFCRTVQAGDPNPLVNVATVTCDVVGFNNQVNDDDDHSVTLIDPSIEVTKTGPDLAKVGDEVCYDIGFTNTGSGDLENCSGTDTVLGALGAFEDGVTRQFCRTVLAGDADPLDNVATITCDVVGFNNTVDDSDDHSVDLVNPAVELTKECRPDPITVGEDINWAITLNNTGDVDLDCTVDDAEAGFTAEPVSVAAGTSETINASRATDAGDVPAILNTASASCTLSGVNLPNVLTPPDANAECEVIEVNEFCRTPGFWGTHAGTEKRRSNNLTQTLINAAGGSISVCGQTIDNTNVANVHSAVEAMCVSIDGKQQRQLARQLTAAALNCIASGGGADCTGTSVATLWTNANAACIANNTNLSGWISQVDAFNNGIGTGCHETEFSEVDAFAGITPLPGPAGSSNACSAATGNGWKVVPAPGGETP